MTCGRGARPLRPRAEPRSHDLSTTLDEMVARRVAALTDYQDAAYAARYSSPWWRRPRRRRRHGRRATAASPKRSRATTSSCWRYKDEYEVARLYSDPAFRQGLREQFAGNFRLTLHLAPPLIAKRDPDSGHLTKREFGPWILSAMRLLARLKGPARHRAGHLRLQRRAPYRAPPDRRLRGDCMEEMLAGLTPDNHALAVELAAIPEKIRGFGHVKEAHLKAAKACEADLLAAFRDPDLHDRTAAE
jgi:indolepyruvate ferredoxin oxidoreductase